MIYTDFKFEWYFLTKKVRFIWTKNALRQSTNISKILTSVLGKTEAIFNIDYQSNLKDNEVSKI